MIQRRVQPTAGEPIEHIAPLSDEATQEGRKALGAIDGGRKSNCFAYQPCCEFVIFRRGRRNFSAIGVVILDMSWSPHLNPAQWRDQDENRRMAVQREPTSGVGAALRANFPVAPLPTELQSLLDKLR